MATKEIYPTTSITNENPLFSTLKTAVETQFYRNNVKRIENIQEAYEMAYRHPNTIVTDMKVKHAKKLGLAKGSRVLVENGGSRVGRNAKARRIVGQANDKELMPIVLDAMLANSQRQFYHGQAVIGLDEDFMVKAHLCINEGQENNLYSWLLNFQIMNEDYEARYKNSKPMNENDIYVYADSDWSHPDFPGGLSYFDPTHNVVCILGMTYFGELKKGTLTLAWATGYRQGYVPCHGGLKIFRQPTHNYVASFFGLSGSGKSTLTHAQHDQKFDIEVLHDDAFLIDLDQGTSIALEPSYFDKTQDYPAAHREQEYFLTVQNVGVTLNENNEKVLVTQDIRNGNGRTVKSRYSTPNRVDKINEPINAIYWIMKDDSLPPLLKIKDPVLASAFGLTLATKRTTAEIGNIDPNALVIEPFANPFRVYNLNDDYLRFKELFEKGVDCFIINTGSYHDLDIDKNTTLSLIEYEITQENKFVPFFNHPQIDMAVLEKYPVEHNDETLNLVKGRMNTRISFIKDHNESKPYDKIEDEALQALQEVLNQLTL